MKKPTSHSRRLIRSAMVAATFILLGAALGFCSEPKNGTWQTSVKASLECSKATGRPVMLVFTGGDWCSYCQRLDQEVFATQEFSRWSRKFIKLSIKYPRYGQLPNGISLSDNMILEKYQKYVEVYPTVLFVNSQGRVVAKTGYLNGGVKAWIANAEALLAKRAGRP